MTLTDLGTHRVVADTNFASGNDWEFDGPAGPESVRTRSVVRCNNGDTCHSIMLAGGGISLQPSFMVARDLRAGRLVEVLPEYRSIELGVYVAIHRASICLQSCELWSIFLAERFAHPASDV